ncbi:neogenin-like [Antedon mediterranea]|uniref:neogenin-like n=1 Tax=Antedon mediterranea TaxID=105859 RepID=UPI003AF5B495
MERFGGSMTKFILKELTPFSTYDVVVLAGVAQSNGDITYGFGRTGSDTTEQEAPDAAPDDITYDAISVRSLNFTWEEITCGHRRGIIDRYNYVLRHGNCEPIEGSVEHNQRYVVLDNLTPCTKYTFTVGGEGVGGKGPASANIEATTMLKEPTGELINMSLVHVHDTHLSFSWEPPNCVEITGYITRLKHSDGTTSKTVSNSTVVFTSLSPCTLYTFQVRTSNGNDKLCPWSEEFTAETAANVPDAVRNVKMKSRKNSITITWESPKSEHCKIDFYKLKYKLQNQCLCAEIQNEDESTVWLSETSHTITSLEAYTSYIINISAVTHQLKDDQYLEGPITTVNATTSEEDVPKQSPASFVVGMMFVGVLIGIALTLFTCFVISKVPKSKDDKQTELQEYATYSAKDNNDTTYQELQIKDDTHQVYVNVSAKKLNYPSPN